MLQKAFSPYVLGTFSKIIEYLTKWRGVQRGAVFCNGEPLQVDVVKKTAEKTLYLKDGSFVSVVFRTNVPQLGTVAQLITRTSPSLPAQHPNYTCIKFLWHQNLPVRKQHEIYQRVVRKGWERRETWAERMRSYKIDQSYTKQKSCRSRRLGDIKELATTLIAAISSISQSIAEKADRKSRKTFTRFLGRPRE